MLQKISNVMFKYKDCDNDVISIENTTDLLVAYEYINDEGMQKLILYTTFEACGEIKQFGFILFLNL